MPAIFDSQAVRGHIVSGALLLASQAAFALDTNEPYDEGATDYEFYVGGESLGSGDAALFFDTLLAFGLTPILGLELELISIASSDFSSGYPTLQTSLVLTPLDREHVDIDIFAYAGLTDAGLRQPFAGTLLELNVDARDDLSAFGGYLRLGAEFRNDAALDADLDDSVEVAVPIQVGGYWSASARHQLLLEYGTVAEVGSEDIADPLKPGRITLGHNVVLGYGIELLSDVHVDLPAAGRSAQPGFSIGFIKTWGAHANPGEWSSPTAQP